MYKLVGQALKYDLGLVHILGPQLESALDEQKSARQRVQKFLLLKLMKRRSTMLLVNEVFARPTPPLESERNTSPFFPLEVKG
jgi:hypothetical protein